MKNTAVFLTWVGTAGTITKFISIMLVKSLTHKPFKTAAIVGVSHEIMCQVTHDFLV